MSLLQNILTLAFARSQVLEKVYGQTISAAKICVAVKCEEVENLTLRFELGSELCRCNCCFMHLGLLVAGKNYFQIKLMIKQAKTITLNLNS
jgi:hypothetical protein